MNLRDYGVLRSEIHGLCSCGYAGLGSFLALVAKMDSPRLHSYVWRCFHRQAVFYKRFAFNLLDCDFDLSGPKKR